MDVLTTHRNIHDYCRMVECVHLPQTSDLELKRMVLKRLKFMETSLSDALKTVGNDEFLDCLKKDVLKSFDCSIQGFLVPNAFSVPCADLPAIVFPTNEHGFNLKLIGNKFSEEGLLSFATKFQQSTPKKVFNKVLIANRGEIAVRIIRTLKRMGIQSVAIYTKPDQYSLHVQQADEAVFLPGDSIAETYLNIELIISIARNTKAEAIIPGYGFLAENDLFAQACIDANIIFVGPTPESINLLGLKHSARHIAKLANVPLTPGSDLLYSLNDALEKAEQFKYPVMIKSTAGGGGIGLQKCSSRTELFTAYETVRRLGESYFNNDGVFLEKFIDNGRHIEVQIFGDGKGKLQTN